MNPFVGVALEIVFAVVLALRRPAEYAPPVLPPVPYIFEPYIAVYGIKPRDRIVAVRSLRAVKASPRQVRGKLGYRYSEKLTLENVVGSLLQIGKNRFKPFYQPFCDLAKKNSALAGRVYKGAVFDTNRKSLLRHTSAEKGLK